MAVGYFNPRPAGGAFGGATTVVDPQFQAQPQGIPQWLVPAGLAATGAGAIGGGLALRHLNAQIPQAPAPFNVGYGNGIVQQPGTLAQQQVQQFSAQALQDRMLAQQQANQFVSQAPVTDLGRGISPADIRVNPMSIPQGAGVGTGSPSFASLMGSNPYAEAAGVMPATSLPNATAGIYNFPGATTAAAPAEQSFLQGLKSNAFLKSPAVDATTAGLEATPALTGAAKYLDYGKMGLKGIGKGVGGLAIATGANALADALPVGSNARPGIRAMGNVGGAMFALPAIGGGLAATAAVPGVGGAEAISRSAAGNEVINAGRNASTNPLANLVANAIPVLQWSNIGYKVSDLLNGGDGGINTDNRTNDTVFDVLGGGNNNAAQAAAPVLTPEERLAQTSPDSLLKIASDYGLSDAMKQKLVKNYNQAMVMAKATGGAVPLDVSKDGKLSDGSDPKDYPGAKQMPDAQGNKQWVTTNPADVQQHVFQQATQLIPSLGHAQEQEDDFFRKQAVMQSQLEAAMPTLYDAPSWQGDPYAKQLAMTEARAIPSRYVQAQALQAQQAYDNQIAQAMQQQQLAQQYPDLFGKKSSSSQPTTLDAAMAQ